MNTGKSLAIPAGLEPATNSLEVLGSASDYITVPNRDGAVAPLIPLANPYYSERPDAAGQAVSV
jgi:hypothetical protein